MKYGVISLVLCISSRLRLVTILSLLVKYLIIFHADPCNKSYIYIYTDTNLITFPCSLAHMGTDHLKTDKCMTPISVCIIEFSALIHCHYVGVAFVSFQMAIYPIRTARAGVYVIGAGVHIYQRVR